jgi:hypothetical protein
VKIKNKGKKVLARAKHAAKTAGHRAKPVMKHTAKKSVHYAHAGVKHAYRGTKHVAKRTHHHVAARPHAHLQKRWRWYANWHGKKYHPHVHFSILAFYVFVIGAMLVTSYGRVLAASDLYDYWDFSNPGDFSLDSGLETSGTSARMKAQNYSDDVSTMALYHLDEASGTAVTDNSSHGNNATLSNGSFGAGNLNNAVTLNGVTSRIAVPDSASLSLSQQNSLEAWTKLNSNFSAGSATQRQGILDKGDYQLYYDNETGKVVYELADKNASTWSLAGGNDTNGGWDTNGKRSVNTTTKIGSSVYVGIGVDVGDAEVWRWNGSTWTLIGGGPGAINDSWDPNTFEGVYTLTTDGTNLYAGLGLSAGDGEVWRFNGSTWTKIGGDGLNSGWAAGIFEEVWSLDYFNGTLYAGLGSSANDAEVWSWNGTAWTKIGGDSLNSGWTANYEAVTSLTDDGTNLYAGLGVSAGDGEVWRWNGTSWTKLGGDGVNSGWDATIETVRTLRYLGTTLYAGLGDTAGDADVWSWNGFAWTQIGGDGINGSWAATTYEQIGAFAWDGTNLYAGLGTSNGDGEAWSWNGSAWTQIGGDTLNGGWTVAQGDTVNTLIFDSGTIFAGTYDAGGDGLLYSWNGTSWTQVGGAYVNKSWGYYGIGAVQVMQSAGGYLYAGTGNAAGASLVFRFDGTSWSLIGGQGVNSSWAPFTYEQVMSMASFNNKLYVGLGTSANDAEVWEWNGSAWTQVGGDSLNSGWTTNYEEVDSMAAYNGYLYAGLGSSNGDGEVWRYNGSVWTKIGGDSLNSGWTNYADNVYSMAIYNGHLVVGIGRSAGDGEAWEWNGSNAWSKIGGDGVNSGWGASATIEDVESLMPFDGKLYAGLGASTGDATLWEYNGTAWTEVGGDDINGSWTAGTYEKVKSLVAYDGNLYAGLGNTAGDGEVWQYKMGVWTKIGGNSLNSGWTNVVEEVESFSPYKGKLYAGTGISANADNLVWSWGNNGYLESAATSFDTAWHHIAATYDGATMKLFIDGTLDNAKAVNVLMPDSDRPLLIGTTYGGREIGKSAGAFAGQLDEIRISDTARSSFTAKPYSTSPQTVTLGSAIRTSGVWHWDNFATDEAADGGTITYRLSDDGGSSWKYWNGSGWVLSASTGLANAASVVDAHINTFPVTVNGITWQAVLQGNGNQRVTLNSATLASTSDINEPSSNASTIVASKTNGGTALNSNDWTNGGSPYFSWTAGTDDESGVRGYCLYLGTDNTADPVTTKGLLGTSPAATGGACQFVSPTPDLDLATAGILGTPLTTSSSPYYLLIKTVDNAGNVTSGSASFHFRFDNTPPSNPGFITSPSGFINTKLATLTWPTTGGNAANDAQSGYAGMQYRIGSGGSWYGDLHTGAGDMNDLLANDGSYTTTDPPDFDNLSDGINTVYFRSWDTAGNVTSTYVTAILKINTSGAPSEPQNLAATPTTNTANSFAFSWDAPSSFVGDASNITYCYVVNTLPSNSNCVFTPAGVRNLGAGPFATQPGTNTLYVVARDESNNINYASFASVNFSANTTAPGIPRNADIVDVSIKSTNNWRLALTWDIPTSVGAGISSYRVFRSTDNTTFSLVGSSSSTTYIDAGLSQVTYYYFVRACDSTNNCGSDSTIVSMLPTGKYTSPALMTSDPIVSDITTKRATIRWSTDRGSDSKITIGTTSGLYSASEIGNSNQVTGHSISLDNLAAGTTYYFRAKWTDEDGNTGTSQEYSFTTSPAPTLKEVNTLKANLSGAVIRFTSKNAAKVRINYGTTESFGGVQTINTSLAESDYNVELVGLADGARYFYKLTSFDTEGGEYESSIFSFRTPARPRITNVRSQPVPGEPTSTQNITWQTNVPANTTVTYGKVGSAGIDEQRPQLVSEHELTISGLEDDSEYFLIAQSRDADGNLAVSEKQIFRTALDTRPPKVSDINIEASIRGSGAEARGQVVISWKTDEPSTSQVAYGEGSNVTAFNSKTSEDSELSTEHIVIISDLPTSKVYSIQPISRDRAGNAGTGETQSTIIGRASDSVLTVIINSLQKVFGF